MYKKKMEHCQNCAEQLYESRLKLVTSINFREAHADVKFIIACIDRINENESNRRPLILTSTEHIHLTQEYEELEIFLFDTLFARLHNNLFPFSEYNLFQTLPENEHGINFQAYYNYTNLSTFLRVIRTKMTLTQKCMENVMKMKVLGTLSAAMAKKQIIFYEKLFRDFDINFHDLQNMLGEYAKIREQEIGDITL